MKQNYDHVIIGGGAAGLAAAIAIKEEAPDASVLLLEREARVGKKLLVTGNGRCNITNRSSLQGRYQGDKTFAHLSFSRFGVDETLNWLAQHGIPCVELEEGKMYPRSLQANSVVDQLRFAVEDAGITEVHSCTVSKVSKDKFFSVIANTGTYSARHLLIATGGKSGVGKYDGPTGYDLLSALGHKVTKLTPGIVQVTTEKEPIKPLTGIKIEGIITATVGGQSRTEEGEILFTEYGLSGPPVLQISSLIGLAGQGELLLNLLPALSFEEIVEEIAFRCRQFAHRPCEDLLTGFMNKRLGQTVMKRAGIEKLSRLCGTVSAKEQKAITHMAVSFPLTATGTKGWNNAQVTVGGVETRHFNPATMESTLVKGLYAAGEVLNVTGDCGGFNLQWAWTSGILAGRAMAKGEVK